MSLHVILGQIDPAATFAIEQFAMPLLDDLPAIDLAAEALSRAADQRSGHVLVGPPGVGKSIALQHAVARFEANEQELLARYPEVHRLRRVLVVETLTAKTPRALLLTLVHATLSPNVPFSARRGGTPMDEDALRLELLTRLLKYRYVVIAVDDAETMTPAALQEFRHVISKTKAHDPARIRAVAGVTSPAPASAGSPGGPPTGGASAGSPTQLIGAGGVGVVLAGTEAVEKAVLATPDAAGRWATVTPVAAQAPEAIPGLYVRIFPRFAEHVAAVGEAAWAQFVDAHVTRGRALDLRLIENHCWRYFATVVNGTAGEPHAVHTREQAFFDREAFLHALTVSDYTVGLDRVRERRTAGGCPAGAGGR